MTIIGLTMRTTIRRWVGSHFHFRLFLLSPAAIAIAAQLAPLTVAGAQPFDSDEDGHGTHVTGLAAGANGIGVAPKAKWIHACACNFAGYCRLPITTFKKCHLLLQNSLTVLQRRLDAAKLPVGYVPN